MKVHYDPETDTLTMRPSNQQVMESDEANPGVILDYDKDGNVVGIKILKASKAGATPQSIEYATVDTQTFGVSGRKRFQTDAGYLTHTK